MEKREGLKFVTEAPNNEKIVAMVTFNGHIYVATERQVLVLVDDELKPVEFIIEKEKTNVKNNN